MTLFSISLRARDVAERPGDVRLRRPQRSGDIRTVRTRQGSNIQKRRYPTDISFFCIIESTRRDSNPRPSPWQGDTPPLSHSCMSFSCLCSLEQYILYRIKKDLSTEKLKKFIFFNFSVIYHQLRTKYSRNGMEGELDK